MGPTRMTYTIRTVGPIAPALAIATVIDLSEAKAHLRVDLDHEDELIAGYLQAAQDHVERFTSQVLTPRAMEMTFGAFPVSCLVPSIKIPREPVTAITSIAYTDSSDGSAVDLVDGDWRWSESQPRLVLPPFGGSWPTAAVEAGAVRLRFEAGYDEGLAPASLVAAVKLVLGHLYEHRGALGEDLPAGAKSLCQPYRGVSI
jgi:uncharacterized phiE125 gp8 family phage protein